MVTATLERNKDELREFYKWLLSRAQEEEGNGNERSARIFRDYAEIIKDEISF